MNTEEIAVICKREKLNACGLLEGCERCLSGKGGCDSLRGDPPVDEVERAVAFLRAVGPPIKTPKFSSYGLKHAAENWARKHHNGNPYVSNGALLVAAYHLGFPVKRNKLRHSLNALVGVSKRNLNRECPLNRH